MESSDRLPFDLREMQAKGARVLTEGLSAFPAEFTPSTTTPLAYWKTESFGFMVFLTGLPNVENHLESTIWTGQYHLSNGEWIPRGPWIGGGDGIPGPPDETEEEVIRWAGGQTNGPDDDGPALVIWGWCFTVARLSLIQNQNSVSIPVGHLGSWVVGSELRDPWRVEANDDAGNILGFINQASR